MTREQMRERSAAYRAETEAALREQFRTVFPPIEDSAVAAAAAYSLLDGGKRVRGMLALSVCELISGKTAPAASYAAAIEMVHCYSLIHDDLPCMDNDDYRRGKLSCHKKFGETTALLAGDALLTAAFDTLTRNENTAAQNAEAVRLLAHAAGPCGMVLGQELDLAAEETPVDEAGLLRVHENKTGRLIRAAVGLGAAAGGAGDRQKATLDRYAADIGLVFQIVDDVLDVSASAEQLGKPVGSDRENNKTTFVTLKGVEAAMQQATVLTQEACEVLQDGFGEKAAFLCQFAQQLLHREK